MKERRKFDEYTKEIVKETVHETLATLGIYCDKDSVEQFRANMNFVDNTRKVTKLAFGTALTALVMSIYNKIAG